MRVILFLCVLLMFFTAVAQSEQTFVVKKKNASPQQNIQRDKIYKLNLFVGIDTIYGGGYYDFTAARGWHDSIATTGMKYTLYQNGTYIALYPLNQRWDGTAMIKLYKKDSNGSMNLVYMKNFYTRVRKKQ